MQKKTQISSSTTSSSVSDDEWVYNTGAGCSDDSSIQWKRNKKTEYAEYYNEKTSETWVGYNIA